MVPATISGNAAVPAVALTGDTDVIVGVGSDEADIVKGAGAEIAPKLETVIDAVPADAISAAGTAAVSCVGLTKAVTLGEPFQSTTEPFTKFAPFTVRVNPEGLQDGVVFDEVVEAAKEVIEGGTIINGLEVGDVPPPGPRVITST